MDKHWVHRKIADILAPVIAEHHPILAARREEREVIVAWLRTYAVCLVKTQEVALNAAADAIERGDHLKAQEKQE